MTQFEKYENKREDQHTEDEKDYKYDCENCGQLSTHRWCCRSCYLTCKADSENDL